MYIYCVLTSFSVDTLYRIGVTLSIHGITKDLMYFLLNCMCFHHTKHITKTKFSINDLHIIHQSNLCIILAIGKQCIHVLLHIHRYASV